MKYIDTEKLIAEIERLRNIAQGYLRGSEKQIELSPSQYRMKGIDTICSYLLSFITSLQQEQPEVDLEKEVKRWKNKQGVVGMDDLWLNFAHHFYELGLNTRKEE